MINRTQETRTMVFDLRAGLFKVDTSAMRGHLIFDLGVFEVVDAAGWHGFDPHIELKTKQRGENPNSSYVKERTSRIWQVANYDAATGERVVVMTSHCSKDEAFLICQRLNILCDYARSICSPWRENLEADEKIPVDELAEEMRHNPPRFKFGQVVNQTPPPRRQGEHKLGEPYVPSRKNIPDPHPKREIYDDPPSSNTPWIVGGIIGILLIAWMVF